MIDISSILARLLQALGIVSQSGEDGSGGSSEGLGSGSQWHVALCSVLGSA